ARIVGSQGEGTLEGTRGGLVLLIGKVRDGEVGPAIGVIGLELNDVTEGLGRGRVLLLIEQSNAVIVPAQHRLLRRSSGGGRVLSQVPGSAASGDLHDGIIDALS